MDEKVLKRLEDIRMSVLEIESYFDGQAKVFAEFSKNVCLRRAVERNVEIIGEAMNHILKVEPNIEISNARRIVDARNYIIHGYDSLSVDILWSIVVNHIPVLKEEVESILAN